MATYPTNGGKPIFNEFITPIGLFVHMYHDKPMLKTVENTKQPVMDKDGFQEAEYKVTMAWSKTRQQELAGLIECANRTKGEAWPQSVQPGAFFALQPFFRDGDNPEHNTKNKEYLHGRYYLNFKQKGVPIVDPVTKKCIGYSGNPGLIGPYEEDIMPMDVYAGCTGRVSGIMFGTEYMGKNFISVRLNNIQKFEDGDRIGGGGRPDAKSQFGALKEPTIGAGMGLGIGGSNPLGSLGALGGGKLSF